MQREKKKKLQREVCREGKEWEKERERESREPDRAAHESKRQEGGVCCPARSKGPGLGVREPHRECLDPSN